MKNIFTIIAILMFTLSNAQGLFNKIYEKPYNNYADAVIERTDGNIFVLGSSNNPTNTDFVLILSLIDPVGNVIWDKFFETPREGHSLMETSDNNFLAVGTHSDHYPYLIKFDVDGNMLWEQSYPAQRIIQGYSIGETRDNNYYFVGASGSTSYLYLTDTSGNLIWSRSYEVGDLVAVKQTADNGFILTGTTDYFNGPTDIVLLKVDADGNEVWSKVYGDEQEDGARSVLQLPDEGYVIAGSFDDPDAIDDEPLSYIIRTNSVGDTLWTKKIFFGISQHIKALNNENGFIHSSWRLGEDIFLFGISKLDEFGETVWSREFDPGYLYAIGNNISETADGGFLLTGSTSGWQGESDIRLIKLDRDGNFVPLSINEFGQESANLIVYPNPASNNISFKLEGNDENSIDELIIYTASGKVVRKFDEIKNLYTSINVSDFISGIYFFRLITYSNSVMAGKFIVEN